MPNRSRAWRTPALRSVVFTRATVAAAVDVTVVGSVSVVMVDSAFAVGEEGVLASKRTEETCAQACTKGVKGQWSTEGSQPSTKLSPIHSLFSS